MLLLLFVSNINAKVSLYLLEVDWGFVFSDWYVNYQYSGQVWNQFVFGMKFSIMMETLKKKTCYPITSRSSYAQDC